MAAGGYVPEGFTIHDSQKLTSHLIKIVHRKTGTRVHERREDCSRGLETTFDLYIDRRTSAGIGLFDLELSARTDREHIQTDVGHRARARHRHLQRRLRELVNKCLELVAAPEYGPDDAEDAEEGDAGNAADDDAGDGPAAEALVFPVWVIIGARPRQLNRMHIL